MTVRILFKREWQNAGRTVWLHPGDVLDLPDSVARSLIGTNAAVGVADDATDTTGGGEKSGPNSLGNRAPLVHARG